MLVNCMNVVLMRTSVWWVLTRFNFVLSLFNAYIQDAGGQVKKIVQNNVLRPSSEGSDILDITWVIPVFSALCCFVSIINFEMSINPPSMKTYLPPSKGIERKWYLVDAQDRVLGRLASRLATILMGKDKVWYTDFLDTGDFLVVVNADKIRLTGKKWEGKSYYRHSGYPGGLKETKAKDLLAKHPEDLLRFAVKGMLPKSKLGDKMFKKLKVYAGSAHPHQAQNPESLVL